MQPTWVYWTKKVLKYPLLWFLNLSVAEVEKWQRAPGFHIPGTPPEDTTPRGPFRS
jgi:hypothetical protein